MKLLIVLLSIAFMYNISAQSNNSYQIELKNVKSIDKKTYEFDVSIRVPTAINLSAYQCAFSFNQKSLNGGALKIEYIQGTSQLNNKPLTSQLVTSNGQPILVFASAPGFEQVIDEKLIGKFRITNTNEFTKNEKINLQWNFTSTVNTIIMGTDSKEITSWFYFKPKK